MFLYVIFSIFVLFLFCFVSFYPLCLFINTISSFLFHNFLFFFILSHLSLCYIFLFSSSFSKPFIYHPSVFFSFFFFWVSIPLTWLFEILPSRWVVYLLPIIYSVRLFVTSSLYFGTSIWLLYLLRGKSTPLSITLPSGNTPLFFISSLIFFFFHSEHNYFSFPFVHDSILLFPRFPLHSGTRIWLFSRPWAKQIFVFTTLLLQFLPINFLFLLYFIFHP